MGASSGLRTECTKCDYARRFAPEYGGRYFRCPRCREGVLAVPRASVEQARAWQTSEDAWLRALVEQVGAADAPPPAKGAGGPDAGPGGGPPAGGPPAGGADDGSSDETNKVAPPLQAAKPGAAAAPAGPAHKGEVAQARRILVECGLCGFHVGIPPAFFGKTVHCPACAGDTVFSESTLEPVKDELIDRMILETHERRALFDPPAARKGTTVRAFLVGVGIGLGALAVLGLVASSRRDDARARAEAEARREGWRWATTAEHPRLLHEPWCVDLVRPDQRVTEEEYRARRGELVLHACE